MPRVPNLPTVGGPSVAPGAVPDAYQRAPSMLGGAGAVRAQQLGAAAQLATQAFEMQQRVREEDDQLRVDDALNALKETQQDLTFNRDSGFTTVRGRDALDRPSGQPLADEYTDRLQKRANELANGLSGERQKRLFGLRANDVVLGFRGAVKRYEGEQADAYAVSVREGTIANRQNEATLYWNDPVKINDALASIDAAVADMGRRLGGKAAEWVEARQRSERSKAVAGAVGAALEKNDFVAADSLLKMFADRMDAADVVKARGLVDKQLDAGIALQAATAVVTAARPAIAPTDYDRMVNITLQAESGGKRYGPNGALLTSRKGAKGEMQVLDSTNRDPGFGVRPAADDSPGERARVGRDYLAAMVKRYDGDLALAWAAYNAGPGAVDEAVTRAGARPGGDWLTFLPKETREYVAKNVAAYTAGEGRPPAPTLQDVHDQVRARIGASNPQRLKIALDESTRQFNEAQAAVKQRDEEGLAGAQRWLAANGGRYAMMPASLRAAVPAGQVDNLLNFADRVAKGEDRTNPAVYQRLSDPAVLRSLSEAQFYSLSMSELSEADRKHFARERQNLLTGAAGDKPGDLNTGAVKNALDTRLRSLGVDPTPKDNGGADAMRVGAVRQFVDRSLLAAQQAAGKKFTDAEVQKHIDGLFAQTDVVKGWFSDTSMPLLTMQASDIPKDVRDRLRADFAAAGIEKPTDGQLLGAYLTARSAQRTLKTIVPLQAAKGKP